MNTTHSAQTVHLAPYFERKNYLEADPYTGTLTTPDSRRMIALPQDLILGLHQTLVEETGRAWPIVIYRCGRKWGERMVETWRDEWRDFYGVSFNEAEYAVFEHWLRRLFAHNGWGELTLDFERQSQGLLEFRLEQSVLVSVLESMEASRVCDLFAGIFAALASSLAGRELEAIELSCSHHDEHESCSFMVALPERVEKARRKRLSDASADELLEILQERD